MATGKSQKLIFLVGPTGVGKTELSLRIAQRFSCEILSLDSMQLYIGMDVGTAKATPEQRAKVPHHLIDLQPPGIRFTVEQYQRAAYEVIEKVAARGHIPLFVGGTGLYLDAILHDFQFANVNADFSLRERLDAAYRLDGGRTLYRRLQETDPMSAEKLTASDRKKIIRSLEVYERTGVPLSRQKIETMRSPKWDALVFVLTDERQALYERINRRVDEMLSDGLVEENMRLLQSGISTRAQAMAAIGYKETVWYLRGRISFSEMRRLIQQNSRNYAKRQLTWYRKDPEAIWLDRSRLTPAQIEEHIIEAMTRFLTERNPTT
ncbi:MAG: tRNA (adenosine(37)-N6)-dimethylallyltransferase MiaA [Ndongobacter sp.]|nr:tRNA (adenosine(37)-N6)-dimethylallyltransferase MiaA [Ndongobacter sp.]